jgi:hypothetical protein
MPCGPSTDQHHLTTCLQSQFRHVNYGRVPWSGGIEGVVVNLSDVLELVARS